jgi:hypothetical protein
MITAVKPEVVGNLLDGVAGQELPFLPMTQSVLHLLQNDLLKQGHLSDPDLFTPALTDA